MEDSVSITLSRMGGRRKKLVVVMLAVLVGSASASAWYFSTHSRIGGAWRVRIYPDYDETLTLRRSDGQEFDVALSGVKMRDGTVVPYDIGLLSESNPPLTVFFEDVHYVDRAGESYELITIEDPKRLTGTPDNGDKSLGPAGRLISSTGKYAVLTDRNGVATFGKTVSFVPTLAGGGALTKIEIDTPYSLVRRIKEQPVDFPFQ